MAIIEAGIGAAAKTAEPVSETDGNSVDTTGCKC